VGQFREGLVLAGVGVRFGVTLVSEHILPLAVRFGVTLVSEHILPHGVRFGVTLVSEHILPLGGRGLACRGPGTNALLARVPRAAL